MKVGKKVAIMLLKTSLKIRLVRVNSDWLIVKLQISAPND